MTGGEGTNRGELAGPHVRVPQTFFADRCNGRGSRAFDPAQERPQDSAADETHERTEQAWDIVWLCGFEEQPRCRNIGICWADASAFPVDYDWAV